VTTVKRRTTWRACAVMLAVGVVAAVSSPAADTTNPTNGCIQHFDPSTDYFTDKVTVDDATNFSVEYRKSYKVVSVKEAYAGGPAERYVLVQCGAPAPKLEADLASAQVVPVPATSLFLASPTHLPLLVDLGRLDVLTGVSSFKDLIGDDVTKRAATGHLREFAARQVIDAEFVVSSRPSLLMTGGAFSAALGVIRSAGIPVVANIEYLEPTALGRAEWMKYMALFLN
jgi:iron complex transport system substrate-binding protein